MKEFGVQYNPIKYDELRYLYENSEVVELCKLISKFIKIFKGNNYTLEKMDEFIRKHGKHVKKKVLVVDDSGAMLRNVKGWLEDKYQVILANSGAMTIKYLATNRPDLVLLDYEMTGKVL